MEMNKKVLEGRVRQHAEVRNALIQRMLSLLAGTRSEGKERVQMISDHI